MGRLSAQREKFLFWGLSQPEIGGKTGTTVGALQARIRDRFVELTACDKPARAAADSQRSGTFYFARNQELSILH